MDLAVFVPVWLAVIGRRAGAPSRGYFMATTGNVTDEAVKKYIESQGVEAQDDDKFKISE